VGKPLQFPCGPLATRVSVICTRPTRCCCSTFCVRSGRYTDRAAALLSLRAGRPVIWPKRFQQCLPRRAGLSINHLGGAGRRHFIAQTAGGWRRSAKSSTRRTGNFGPQRSCHYLGTALWRNGIQRVLSGFVDARRLERERRECDARRRPHRPRGNAARIYRVGRLHEIRHKRRSRLDRLKSPSLQKIPRAQASL